MKLLGKGLFSKVYEHPSNSGLVLIKSCDYIKECMSFGWFPSSSLFPKIERIEAETFVMKRYDMKSRGIISRLTNEKHIALYRELRALDRFCSMNIYDGFDHWWRQFQSLGEHKHIMLEALSACSNYGSDVGFEISPRNVAVHNGKLVLVDCFFMMSQAKQQRSK